MSSFIFGIIIVLTATLNVHLKWDASETPDIDGYKIYYGLSQGGQWPYSIDVGNVTEYLVTDLPEDQEIYFVATAYKNENESEYSNEVVTVAYYFLTIKIEYDSTGKILYRGEHTDYNANENDTNWVITKYYYNTNGMLIFMLRRITSWYNRASGW